MQRIKFSLTIAFSCLVLLLLARMLADVAAYKLGAISATGKSTSSLTPVPSHTSRITTLQSHSVILEKGLFGPATKGQLTPLIQQPATSQPIISQNDLILLGTAAGSARSSFALVCRTSSKEERVFRVGEKVFDLGVLTVVRKETAELRSGNQIITLRTPAAPPEAAKTVATGQPAVQTPAMGVIQASGGNAGVIDQRALNAALDNIGQAMTDARLLPSLKDGKVEGFRLSEVKPQGVFGTLGLKNGDVLAKINDFPVDSPEKAIQSFMTLKGQNRIKLDLLREGAPASLVYDIR